MIQLYLCLTLVGFVVVGPHHDVFDSCSPFNAHSDCESAYRLMSGTEDGAVSLPLSSGSSSAGLLSDTRSKSITVRGKHP